METQNTYSIPFNVRHGVKAVSDPRVHFAHFEHAVDFFLPAGTKVRAAAAGIVKDVHVEERCREKTFDDITYLNHIMIEHENGEYSQYAHLKKDSAVVSVGQEVSVGDALAMVGDAAPGGQPHLHFLVFRLAENDAGWETLEVQFTRPVEILKTNDLVERGLKGIQKLKGLLKRS